MNFDPIIGNIGAMMITPAITHNAPHSLPPIKVKVKLESCQAESGGGALLRRVLVQERSKNIISLRSMHFSSGIRIKAIKRLQNYF